MKSIRFCCVLACALAMFAAASAAADEDLLLVSPDNLSKLWTLDRDSWRKVLNPGEASSSGTGCVAVSFVIEGDGHTSGFRELRSWPDDRFGDLPKRMVAGFQFQPAGSNARKEPVFTYLTISFHDKRDRVLGSAVQPGVEVDARTNRHCEVQGFETGAQ